MDLNNKVSATTPGVITAAIPASLLSQGFNHFGNPDCFEGKLYVPLERNKKVQPQKIAVFNAADLRYLGSADLVTQNSLEKQTNASWCAIDPVTKIIWTSNFYNVDRLFGYQIQDSKVDLPLILKQVYTKKLNRNIKNVQGGAFSKRSKLFYLVSNTTDRGLFALDWEHSRYAGHKKINYSPGNAYSQELEGITVWNAASKVAPNITGQVHAVMIENQLDADNVWVKHFDVNPER